MDKPKVKAPKPVTPPPPIIPLISGDNPSSFNFCSANALLNTKKIEIKR